VSYAKTKNGDTDFTIEILFLVFGLAWHAVCYGWGIYAGGEQIKQAVRMRAESEEEPAHLDKAYYQLGVNAKDFRPMCLESEWPLHSLQAASFLGSYFMVRVVVGQRVYKGEWGGYEAPIPTSLCYLLYGLTLVVWILQLLVLAAAVQTYAFVLPLAPFLDDTKRAIATAVGEQFKASESSTGRVILHVPDGGKGTTAMTIQLATMGDEEGLPLESPSSPFESVDASREEALDLNIDDVAVGVEPATLATTGQAGGESEAAAE